MRGNGVVLIVLFALFSIMLTDCSQEAAKTSTPNEWDIGILPSSVRFNPVTTEVIENNFDAVPGDKSVTRLNSNWVYDGKSANLYTARGEYVSFQLVVINNSLKTLENIMVEMEPFSFNNQQIPISPELFLEWSVEVKTTSGGYPKSTLGKGWYPDALIPFECIQQTEPPRRWLYPLILPDFNNRIEDQKALMIWVDQFIPFSSEDAPPGDYSTTITVRIQNETKSIPVNLKIWDFAIPNENKFRAALQHEGFVSRANENLELQVYQLLKKHRVSVMDPTYKPGLTVTAKGEVKYDWGEFDKRLEKYFTGKAFTKEYGYNFGPGYGEPVENFLPPFDVYGKHDTSGWPDIGKPEAEKKPENQKIYIDAIVQFRNHLLKYIDPEKTMLTVYLNGLDESYFPEAWDRMAYYGELFKKYLPEAYYRIDGSYGEDAMKVVMPSISSWGAHTINYNYDEIGEIRKAGIKDWIYGSMIYESNVNSWVGSSTYIDLPLVNERAISWSAFKYGTFSWISWGIGAGWMAAWYDTETWKDYRDDRDGERQEQKVLNGNGSLIYPPNIIPNVSVVCPSIRLKNIRNGIQEYEYLTLLKKLTPNKNTAYEIVDEIINKPFGPNAIGVIDIWSFNAEEWDKKRIQIGELINSL